MVTTILVLMIIIAILLIIIVLIQNPKGGGISSEFGGGATSQMFGVQRTGDLMEQLTWGFFAFLLIASLSIGIFARVSGPSTVDNGLNVERSTGTPSSIPAPANTIPAAPQQTPAAPASK